MKKMTLSAAMLALWGTAAFAADPFTLTSSSFKDGAMMDVKHAGATKANPNCVGQNVSPELKWTNAPAAAKSFVLVMTDWEGQSGLGAHHLLAYNIKPDVTGFAEGELSKPTPTSSPAARKAAARLSTVGLVTPAGLAPHHYIFTVIATDLDPGALPAGLTRDELWEKLKGHAKGVAGIVGLFER